MIRHAFIPVTGPMFFLDVRDPPPPVWMLPGDPPRLRISDYNKPATPNMMTPRRFTRERYASDKQSNWFYVEDGAQDRTLLYNLETELWSLVPR